MVGVKSTRINENANVGVKSTGIIENANDGCQVY